MDAAHAIATQPSKERIGAGKSKESEYGQKDQQQEHIEQQPQVTHTRSVREKGGGCAEKDHQHGEESHGDKENHGEENHGGKENDDREENHDEENDDSEARFREPQVKGAL